MILVMDDRAELVEFWTLSASDRLLFGRRRGASLLGFVLLLKYFSRFGRFPHRRTEFGLAVVEHVAAQIDVDPSMFASFDLSLRTTERYRSVIREHCEFREVRVDDETRLTAWLAATLAAVDRRVDRLTGALVAEFRRERIELPTPARVQRMVRSALKTADQAWAETIAGRLDDETKARLLKLIDAVDDDDVRGRDSLFGLVKSAPGNLSLDSMLAEIHKLEELRRFALPAGLFSDVAPRIVDGWRSQAMVEAPSHLRRHAEPVTITLLAALVARREREVTDALVELFLATVHRIGARAEKRVIEELVSEFRRVTGKENILCAITDAVLAEPDDTVRNVVFPAVAGGEQTFRDLAVEFKSNGSTYRRTVQTKVRSSYTGHYRRGLIALLYTLDFRSNNDVHKPVIDALKLIRKHGRSVNMKYYPVDEQVPEHKATLSSEWAGVIHETDKQGRERVVRTVYEIVTFQALREQLRCKEIWVAGADVWRNPDEDLPNDFDQNRTENYRALGKPLDANDFIEELRSEMVSALTDLDVSVDDLDWLEIKPRASGPIVLTRFDAVSEPKNLRRIKDEVERRWGTITLIDVLKETVLRTGCLVTATAEVGGRPMPVEILVERLMLALYAYGTNTGIRGVSIGDGHRHTADEIRYICRRYLNAETAQTIAIGIANATFKARLRSLWGEGSTAVASDSTHFRSYDQNVFTEWHSRYGGRGVLVYWHVEEGSMVVHSQTLRASASEVHAMVEGAIRHGTAMSVEGNYVDSHGQSEIGFGITRLLGFDLLPRIKQINRVRLYRPSAGDPAAYSKLAPALTRPIRWDVIAENYDQAIKYATAIRLGTASTEAILRRFTRSASHPTYQAMLEIGRAQRTIFVARYLRSRELQREINEGLNVVELFNRVNAIIFYGRQGELASNRADEQEVSVLCLRILQASLVYINTLLLQEVLAEPEWNNILTPEDRRGLTPMFWSNIAPYGVVVTDVS
jgi:TnpA family transposase